MGTTATNKSALVEKTTVGKNVAPSLQKGTSNVDAFGKRLTKAPSKLVSPFKPYIRRSKVPIATRWR